MFCKRSIFAVLILFSPMNLLKIENEFHLYSCLEDGNDSRSWNCVYWQLYENYRSDITKVSAAALNLDVFEEKTSFEQITSSVRFLPQRILLQNFALP